MKAQKESHLSEGYNSGTGVSVDSHALGCWLQEEGFLENLGPRLGHKGFLGRSEAGVEEGKALWAGPAVHSGLQ